MEALLENPRYAKFMKDLETNKRTMDFKTMEVSHGCSSILSSNLVVKKRSDVFTISCTIGVYQFGKALYDLVASITLMTRDFQKFRIRVTKTNNNETIDGGLVH